MEQIKQRLPFPLLGIDSDNGSEFINAHFTKFCEVNGITFTRSRPNRKNDNCFVEQKNYSIVRKAVGYYRYDTEEERQNKLIDIAMEKGIQDETVIEVVEIESGISPLH